MALFNLNIDDKKKLELIPKVEFPFMIILFLFVVFTLAFTNFYKTLLVIEIFFILGSHLLFMWLLGKKGKGLIPSHDFNENKPRSDSPTINFYPINVQKENKNLEEVKKKLEWQQF